LVFGYALVFEMIPIHLEGLSREELDAYVAHRPPGANLAKSYIQVINCDWDHTYPNAIHTPFQDLVAVVSVQAELNQTNENSGRGK
jgi:hypothetical protein